MSPDINTLYRTVKISITSRKENPEKITILPKNYWFRNWEYRQDWPKENDIIQSRDQNYFRFFVIVIKKKERVKIGIGKGQKVIYTEYNHGENRC